MNAEHWQKVWRDKTPEAVSWFQADPTPSLAMIDAAGVTPAASVVDVGGGASALVDRLLERGFADVTVLDIAEPALAHARARLGERAAQVAWVCADATAWRPGRRFDLWHDRAVFHFLTELEQRRAYVAVLEQALVPGGQAVFATFAPDGPDRCSGLPVQRYDCPALAAALGPGFTLVEKRAQDHLTPAGSVQRFCWCRFRRS
jgi:trans-aconitate methyltransferase